MRKTLFTLSIILLALGLQACSPHPGAGHWQAREDSTSRFDKILVEFDGKAQLIPGDPKAETQRCFWSGKNARAIQLQCTEGDDTGLEFVYLLSVDATGSEPIATLSLDSKPIGAYRRQQQKQE